MGVWGGGGGGVSEFFYNESKYKQEGHDGPGFLT